MDDDLATLGHDALIAEVKRLRDGIRAHRDTTEQELCWHHPALWGLLPERTDPLPTVPDWPQFMRGCVRYRQSLDEQLADAPRSAVELAPESTTRVLVNVDVDDLDGAVRFYTEAFGLQIARRFGTEAIELVGAAVPLYLLVKEAGTPFAPDGAPRRYVRHWTPVHLDFVVDDLEPALRRALEAGATQEGAVQTHAWGKIALLADPFGHGVCLLQLVGRGYDEVATR